MRVLILGPLEVWDDGRELELGAGRHNALLAFLILHAGDVVPSSRLVEELWNGHPPPSATKLVQGYVSRLRRVLPPDSIASRDSGYVLRAEETDAQGFERLLELADEQQPDEAAPTLRQALALWRGSPLAGFDYEPWAAHEIGRLEELRLVAVEKRIDADIELGRAERVVPELEALVAEHPLRERLCCLLMVGLYRSGRQAEALEVFRAARRRLVDELGIEPGPELRELERRILAHDPALTPAPPRARSDTSPARKPGVRRRTLFVGALAGVVAAAVAVPIFSLSGNRSGGDEARAAPGANAVGVVDQSNDRVAGSVALEAAPTAIEDGAGATWVALTSQDAVARIDPRTNTVSQTITVGNGPIDLAVGDGFVWVANGLDGTVSQIDPKTNGGQVVAKIAVGNGPAALASGLGGIWVANATDRTIVRIDPRSGVPGKPLAVDAGADGIAVGGGAVWVIGESAGELTRIDPRSGRATLVHVGTAPVAVAADDHSVWVADQNDATVWRIDAGTNRVKAVIPVGEGPSGIALGPDGSVWVSNELAGTVSRIDPAVGKVVQTVPVGDRPRDVSGGRDGLFVALQGAGFAHRGGTLTLVVPNPPNVYTPGFPKMLDPAQGYSNWELLTLTNDGLVGYGRSGGADSARVVPDLAVALPAITDGGRTYTFVLRPGIRYSTGAPVRPVDIRRGIERALALSGRNPPSAYLDSIVGAPQCVAAPRSCDLSKGIVADPKANTVTFHLSAPDPDFLYKLALPIADAVPEATPLDARLPLPATGPYRIERYDAKRAVIRLARNAQFRLWSASAQPAGFPDHIVERFGYSSARAVRAVVRGAADVTADGPDQTWTAAQTEMLRTRYAGRLHHAATVGTTLVWLNTKRAPFDDIRVRRALEFAVDRNHLIELAGGPDVARAGCQVLPPNMSGYRRYCPYTTHPDGTGTYYGPDLARARRLVAESGTKGEHVTVWFFDIPIGRRNGAYFVSVLRSLGYDARLRTIPHTAWTWRPGRQIGVGGYALDYPSADNILSMFTCRSYTPERPVENLNWGAYCDRRTDRELARARALQPTDPIAASRLWRTLDRRLTDRALWVVIRTQLVPDFLSKRTGNYTYCYLSGQSGSTGACLDQLWVR